MKIVQFGEKYLYFNNHLNSVIQNSHLNYVIFDIPGDLI
jgi:hypothetical protein